VRAALRAVPGVRQASVWVMVQRRWVYLQGCVPNAALGKRLERAARALPDVEAVVPDLMTGTRGKPPYPVPTKQGIKPPAPRHKTRPRRIGIRNGVASCTVVPEASADASATRRGRHAIRSSDESGDPPPLPTRQ
jgi:hypothetical protein